MITICHIILTIRNVTIIIRLEVAEMNTTDYEEAFGNFLERHEYDDVETQIFSLVRAAFRAGWEAAGGTLPEPEPILQLIKTGEAGRNTSPSPHFTDTP